MGNYKTRPLVTCSETWKNRISENYSLVRRRLNDDLSRAKHEISEGIMCKAKSKDDNRIKDGVLHEHYIACLQGNLTMVKSLITDFNINTKSAIDHLSPLMYAVLSNRDERIEVIEFLISKNAKLPLFSKNGFTAMHLAAAKGDLKVLRCFASKDYNFNCKGFSEITPLHIACLYANEEVAAFLINSGADVNQLDAVQFSALHTAIYSQSDRVRLVSLLLRAGANVTVCGDCGILPIHLAAARGHTDLMQDLLNYNQNIDVNADDNEKNTPFHLAAKHGHMALIDIFYRTGRLEHLVNLYGETPLHIACSCGRFEIAKFILSHFGNELLKLETVYGETPLHSACTYGKNLELIEYLISLNPTLVNFQGLDSIGHTPLHSACWNGHLSVVHLLLQHGADVNLMATTMDAAGNSEQQSCINWAWENGYDKIVQFLNHYRSNGEVHSGCSSTEGSYVPVPSKIGKLRSMTQEKIDVLRLRADLSKKFQIEYHEIERLDRVGSGSFGRVFKANYCSRVVAVKIYRAQQFGNRTDIDMFVREVGILCKLDNPYVIKFIGACVDDPSNFAIVTEFYAGGSLFKFIHTQKRVIDLAHKTIILSDVCQGMKYLHSLSEPIIHRDLTSHNILLRETLRAVVADFGESKLLHGDTGALTKQPGNLRWMAPEVFSLSTVYTVKADVFSFAFCIWEVLSGELPFAHLQPVQAAQEVSTNDARPMLNNAFPPDLVTIMEMCWRTDPDSRPTFAEVHRYFEDFKNRLNIKDCNISNIRDDYELGNSDDRPSVSVLRSHFEKENTKVTLIDEEGYVADPFSTG